MLISLYSGMASWVVLPQHVRPAGAAAIHGHLIFEGTIHSHLLPSAIWAHIWSEWDRHSFASVPEDMGLVLLKACLGRFGTLTPPFSGVREARFVSQNVQPLPRVAASLSVYVSAWREGSVARSMHRTRRTRRVPG